MTVSGDEYQCLQEYARQTAGVPRPLWPRLNISRSAKDAIEPDTFNVFAGISHKGSEKQFDYIKPGQEQRLKLVLDEKYHGFAHLIPLTEAKDLANPRYSSLVYDLMSFHKSVVPFIDAEKDHCLTLDSAEGAVFEFVDMVLDKRFEDLLQKYSFVIDDRDEGYIWVLSDAAGTCLKILSGNTAGIHSYKLQKYSATTKRLGLRGVVALKKFVIVAQEAFRSKSHSYPAYRGLFDLMHTFNGL